MGRKRSVRRRFLLSPLCYVQQPAPRTRAMVPPPATPTEAEANPPLSLHPRRTFDELVLEEVPIQRASVAMEGGMPSCLTLFDNFFLCYCPSSPPPPLRATNEGHSTGFANPLRVPPWDAEGL